MNRQRRLLLLLLVPVLLVGAGLVAFRIFFPAERIAAIAAEQAEAALGREVGIERVTLRFFPAPAVALERVSVAGKTPDSPPLATVRRIDLRPKIFPLFRKQIVVDALVLDRPRILAESDADRVSEIPVVDAATGTTVERGGASIAFLVQSLRIRDGRIAYRDRESGMVVRLDGWDQRLRIAGRLQDGELAFLELDGEIDVAALGAELPEQLAAPIRDLRLHVEHEALLDLEADSIALGQLSVRLQEVGLEGAGTIRFASDPDAREISLRLGAAAFRIEDLIRSLPAALVERAGALPDVRGEAALRIAAEGPLRADSLPEIDGTLTLQRFDLGYADLPGVLTGVGGVVAFSFDSVTTTGFRGQLLDEPFSLNFSLHDLADPQARVSFRASVDLARALRLGLAPDSLDASGEVGIDLAVRGPVLEPEKIEVEGTVDFDGIAVSAPGLLQSVRFESGELVFLGRDLRTERFRLRMGESDLALEARVQDWTALAFADTVRTARAEFDVRSALLDLDALLGVPDSALYSKLLFARMADREIDGRTVAEVAEEAGFGLPPLPPMELEGRVRAWQFRRNGLELHDVDMRLRGRGDRIELTDARFQFMGGGVQIAGQVGLPVPVSGEDEGEPARIGYPTVLTYQLQDVGAAPFFDRFTPFREHLSGALLMAGTARVVLDEHLLPVRESLVAEGSIAVTDGRLANWPVLQALGERLEAAVGFDTLEFRDWAGEFHIAGPRITLSESLLESGDMRVVAAGALDFSGDLDLTATLGLSVELAGRSVVSRVADAVAGEDGRIPVGLRITGPAIRPRMELDFSEASANAVARAREEAEERARELAERAAQKLVERVGERVGDQIGEHLQPANSAGTPAEALRERADSMAATVDSLANTAADSARAKLQDEVRKRLCRIRGCD